MGESHIPTLTNFPLYDIIILEVKIMKYQKKREILTNIQEKFEEFDTKTIDSKNRLNLGEKIREIIAKTKADAFQIFIGDEGDILLRPVVTIPSKEAWIYQNPNVLKRIRKGFQDAGEGRTKQIKDVKNFLKNL